MGAEVDEQKMVRSMGMKGLGNVQKIRLASPETMKKNENSLWFRVSNEPPGNRDSIRGKKLNRFPRKVHIRRGHRRKIAGWTDNLRRGKHPPKEEET